MSHSHVLTLKRPHEAFGQSVSLSRRVGGVGKGTWTTFVVMVTVLFAGWYIYQVNQTAAKSYALRSLERKRDGLVEQVGALERHWAESQALHVMQARAEEHGYIPVEAIEYIEVPAAAYAFAKE